MSWNRTVRAAAIATATGLLAGAFALPEVAPATLASFEGGPGLGLGGRFVAIGDFDADGDADIAVADQSPLSDVLRVLWNDGAIPPAFSSQSLGSAGNAIAAGRVFNLIGGDQIVVSVANSIRVRVWNGASFTESTIASHGASDFWIDEYDGGIGKAYVYYAAGTSAGYVLNDDPGITDFPIASSAVAEAFRAIDVLPDRTGVVLTGAEGSRFPSLPPFSATPGYDVKRGDIDRDGVPDVVVATDDQVVWHRCLTVSGCLGAANPISASQTFRAWRDVELADLDFDGDLDVLAVDGGTASIPPPVCNGNLVWFENDGQPVPGFTQRNLVCFVESSGPNTEWPRSAELGDLDGDGDLDAVWGAALDQILGVASAPGVQLNQASFGWTDGGLRQGLGARVGGRDVNRDGRPDALVATRCTYPVLGGCPGVGRRHTAKLFLGTASGLEANPAWAAEGAQENDGFGSALAFGDWNADGFVDVASGAPKHQAGCNPTYGEKVGRVYVWSGGPGDPFDPTGLGLDGNPANADQILGPPQTFSNSLCYAIPLEGFGAQLATLDFNGDGIDDLAVADPGLFHDECFPSTTAGRGQVVLYRGSTGGLVYQRRIEGERCPVCPCSDRGIADAIAAGNFGGDARDDLAVEYAAGSFDFGVRVYLDDYARNGGVDPDQSIQTQSRRIGVSLAVADTNFDGWDDLALSEIHPTNGARLSLLRGGAGGLAATPWSPVAGGSHAAIASAGQQNRDCYEDLVAASPEGTQLIRGRAGTSGPEPSPSAKLLPGWLQFASLGDVRRDGVDDLLTGNPDQSRYGLETGTNAGGAVALYQGDVDTSIAVPDCDGDGSPRNLDCDDRDASIEPGAVEVCNLRDDDCDLEVDEGLVCNFLDSDGDGFPDDGDRSGIAGDAPCAAGQILACDDNCRVFSNDQTDVDGNGIGNACECGDQNGDGRVNVSDLVAINLAIFNPALVTPLCDTNDDGACNVIDIVGANLKIFGNPAYCSRYPPPPT